MVAYTAAALKLTGGSVIDPWSTCHKWFSSSCKIRLVHANCANTQVSVRL